VVDWHELVPGKRGKQGKSRLLHQTPLRFGPRLKFCRTTSPAIGVHRPARKKIPALAAITCRTIIDFALGLRAEESLSQLPAELLDFDVVQYEHNSLSCVGRTRLGVVGSPSLADLTSKCGQSTIRNRSGAMVQTAKRMQLMPQTVEAFDAYICEGEAAMEQTLRSGGPFLWSDLVSERAQQVQEGQIVPQFWAG
jgi:hypothetical protein